MSSSGTWSINLISQSHLVGHDLSLPVMLCALSISHPKCPFLFHFWRKSWYDINALVILDFKNRVRSKKIQFFRTFRIFCCDAFSSRRWKENWSLVVCASFLKSFILLLSQKHFMGWKRSHRCGSYLHLITWYFSIWFHF